MAFQIPFRQTLGQRFAEAFRFILLERRPGQGRTRAQDAHARELAQHVVGVHAVERVVAYGAGEVPIPLRLVRSRETPGDLGVEPLLPPLRGAFLLRVLLRESGIRVPLPARRERRSGNLADCVRVGRRVVALGLFDRLFGQFDLRWRHPCEGVLLDPHLLARPGVGRGVTFLHRVAALGHGEGGGDGGREGGRQQRAVVEHCCGVQPAIRRNAPPMFGVLHRAARILHGRDQGDHRLAQDVLADIDGGAPEHRSEVRGGQQAHPVDACALVSYAPIVVTGGNGDAVGRQAALQWRGAQSVGLQPLARLNRFGPQRRMRVIQHRGVRIARPAGTGRFARGPGQAQAQRMIEGGRAEPYRALRIVGIDDQGRTLVVRSAAPGRVVFGMPRRRMGRRLPRARPGRPGRGAGSGGG